jgi:hypothetical protein
MKKENITIEKHYAVTTMLAQHAATLNSRGKAILRLHQHPDSDII